MKVDEDCLGAKTSFSASEDRLGRRSENGRRAPAPLAPPPAAPLVPQASGTAGTEAEDISSCSRLIATQGYPLPVEKLPVTTGRPPINDHIPSL